MMSQSKPGELLNKSIWTEPTTERVQLRIKSLNGCTRKHSNSLVVGYFAFTPLLCT